MIRFSVLTMSVKDVRMVLNLMIQKHIAEVNNKCSAHLIQSSTHGVHVKNVNRVILQIILRRTVYLI